MPRLPAEAAAERPHFHLGRQAYEDLIARLVSVKKNLAKLMPSGLTPFLRMPTLLSPKGRLPQRDFSIARDPGKSKSGRMVVKDLQRFSSEY